MSITKHLEDFVAESNGIEEIIRPPTIREMLAHFPALCAVPLGVQDMEMFVGTVTGEHLRRRKGMDVAVGAHSAPPGGPEIEERLRVLLGIAASGAGPYRVHLEYEHLHPFTDGNGRSGRFLWLWTMVNAGRIDAVWRYGFRRCWYYQSLEDYDYQRPPA